jgi:hypothetical protein
MGMELPRQQKAPRFFREDECANFWPGCRPAWALVSATGFARGVPHYRVGGLRGREIGELFRVVYRSVSQEWKRLRDRLSDDRNGQNLFKGFLGKCND